jgi:hypothetical protein
MQKSSKIETQAVQEAYKPKPTKPDLPVENGD